MIALPLQFAQASDSSSGLGAFHLNLKGFLFQLATFVLVLLVLRKWVVPTLVTTIDKRREALEQSLADAKATTEALAKAETKAEELLATARKQADLALAEAQTKSEDIIAKGETAASERALRIIDEAEKRLDQEHAKLHDELKQELANLVAAATEKVLRQKINQKEDRKLIEQSLKDLA